MTELVVITKLIAKPQCAEPLETELQNLATFSRADDNCLLYTIHRDVKNPDIFLLVQRWTSQETLESHVKSFIFLQHAMLIGALILAEPEIHYLETLSSGDKGQLN